MPRIKDQVSKKVSRKSEGKWNTRETCKRDLQERTQVFGQNIIKLCKSLKYNPITAKIIDQIVRSGTSIGANYMEAVNASSKKEFRNKLFICKKEAQETRYWLVMLKECCLENSAIDELAKECHELNLIFQKSINTLNTSST